MNDHYPSDVLYTKEHEWARRDGEGWIVGVTFHAQEALGDVPKVGAALTAGKAFGVIESTKAVSELFAPLSGTVERINEKLSTDPALINADPHGAGWIVHIRAANEEEVAALIDAERCRALLLAGSP